MKVEFPLEKYLHIYLGIFVNRFWPSGLGSDKEEFSALHIK